MNEPADIQIDISSVDAPELAEKLGTVCTDTAGWSRDGILEHQISTREDVQLCFRNEPSGDRPRSALCLAGTAETLTVAAVVPIDRGPELSDSQYEAVVEEFYETVLAPVADELPISATKIS